MFVLGALVLVALVWVVGVDALLATARNAEPVPFVLAFLAYALFFLVRGVRWRLLLKQSAPDMTTATTTKLTAVGWLANNILPLKGGDVLRAALLARRGRIALVTSAASVALERVLDLLSLAVLAAVALLLIPRAAELPGWLVPALQAAAVLPVLAIALLFVLVRVRDQAVESARRLMRPLGKPGRKLASLFETVVSGVAALSQQPRLMLTLLPWSMLVVVLQALVFTFLLRAFVPGVDPLVAFAGGTLFLLSFVVSITPGNVGTYEAAFIAIYGALGVAAEAVVPAAILTHVSTLLIVAVLGGAGVLALGSDPDLPVTFRISKPSQGGSP